MVTPVTAYITSIDELKKLYPEKYKIYKQFGLIERVKRKLKETGRWTIVVGYIAHS